MKALVPVYTLTLLLSALLLFTVQPMTSKMILPLLGGAPNVWTTAMLFFQITLLAGYAYAHGTTKILSIKSQVFVHISLLILFTTFLPFNIPQNWIPPEGENPTLWQLAVMGTVVGGPFFVIAASAPMLQRWFSVSDHKDAHNPYFLYGASNLGSLSGLLLYPFLFEPMMSIPIQSKMWMFGYVLLIPITLICFLLIRADTQKNLPRKMAITTDRHPILNKQRIKWLLLSFIPSSLMLSLTTYITTDIAAAPLFWVLPLAIYIGTFVVVFARKQFFTLQQINNLSGIAVCLLIVQMIILPELLLSAVLIITFHMCVFLIVALASHSELAYSKPAAADLTEFFLIISVGGALGGVFNAIIAPNFFVIPIEYALSLGLAISARYSTTQEMDLRLLKSSALYKNSILIFIIILIGLSGLLLDHGRNIETILAIITIVLLTLILEKRWIFTLATVPLLFASPISLPKGYVSNATTIHQERNFFGILRVLQSNDINMLVHGVTTHGLQMTAGKHKLEPLAYYGFNSPLVDTFRVLEPLNLQEQKIAVIGLGTGALACYTAANRAFDLYEIDKGVADIATNPEYFTYLTDCGSPYKIHLGDGRLKIQKQPDNTYDAIIVDAFSSDSIPTHLITKEAIEIYISKLKPHGVLTFHISNSFMDLEPLLAATANDIGIKAFGRMSNSTSLPDEKDKLLYKTHGVILTNNPSDIKTLNALGWTSAIEKDGQKAWTDKFSNIVSVLGSDVTKTRNAMLSKHDE